MSSDPGDGWWARFYASQIAPELEPPPSAPRPELYRLFKRLQWGSALLGILGYATLRWGFHLTGPALGAVRLFTLTSFFGWPMPASWARGDSRRSMLLVAALCLVMIVLAWWV